MARIGARDFGGVEHEFDLLGVAFIDDVEFNLSASGNFEEGSAPGEVGSNIAIGTSEITTGVDDGDVVIAMGHISGDVDADIDGCRAEVLNLRGEGILGCRIGWEISPNGLIVGFEISIADFSGFNGRAPSTMVGS